MLSIVTGTYQRLSSLIRMIDSVRLDMPIGIPYEFVIVDGGSTDGTIQWCKAQRDINFIEHGELRGAINAFCDGAYAAKYPYVIMANDDITFEPGSLVRAMVYLEQHSQCGGVAFMDDRQYVPGETVRYKAQLQPSVAENGEGTKVIYAQVGMFRRWLGDLCDWWGSHDAIMSTAQTYGGDNFLSSMIWESGYTIDIVQGVCVTDHHRIVVDDLRKVNQTAADHAYWDRFPKGPHINCNRMPTEPKHDEKLRILYMPIFEPGFSAHRSTKRGLFDALSKIATVWEWDYLNERINANAMEAFNPHLVLTQFHDGKQGNLIAMLRNYCPTAKIINWNGDARGLTEPDYLDMLRKVDAQLVVNAAALPIYARENIAAAYWQIGYESWQILTDVESHDVVFLGNCYNDERRALEKAVRANGFEAGFYGIGWKQIDGENLYDFSMGAALYEVAKIAVGDTFTDGGKTQVEAYVSNRLFQALAAGVFMLQQYSPALDYYTGLKAGVHYVEWKTLDDLTLLIDRYLHKEKERQKIAAVGQAFVLENFSFDAQVRKLFVDILPALESEKSIATA